MISVIEKKLDQRFKEFLAKLTQVENIDNLNLNQQQKDESKADYFAESRQLIIELKSLETDTEHKIEKIHEPQRSRPEFPDFYGEWQVSKILKYLPDGKEINRQIIDAVTSSLKEIYRKANRQIRTTKLTFNLPDAQGLLILLNQKIDVLAPDVIFYRLRKIANKKNPDKSFQFPEINYILLINEAHYSPAPNNSMGFFILHQPINNVSKFKHENFLENLTKKWAEFNNVSLHGLGELKSLKDLKPSSVAQYNKEQEKLIPRHESWRRYYRRTPYFSSYDEDMMKWMFEIIMSELAPSMLKGATQQQRDRGFFWLEIFTHFLEEVNYRGMDMKIFKPITKRLGEEIERQMKERFPDLK
ncbi:MAG TPA: hypothetical protein VF596_06050 [Pyrinomonadaceae bacterium]|jgi:hypothetical protein